ncbi:MAG: hypothetical protein FWH57_03830 [Oscillospiraceae bacterium]|nr:hypothetical protein [Oscillospiraceae bacterium]
MKGVKLTLCIVCAIVAIAAAITLIIIYRNEITRFFANMKSKFDEKRLHRDGEYEDYVD